MSKEAEKGAILYLILFFILLIVPQKNVHSEIHRVDLLAHVVSFFLLYFVLRRGLNIKFKPAIVITFSIAIFTEGIQFFIPWRDFSFADMIADVIGLIIGGCLDMKENLLVSFIATFGFVGYIPLGPGTFAALLTTLILYFLNPSFLLVLEGLGLVFFSGWVASARYSKLTNKMDPGEVVIDEVAGLITAVLFLPRINILYLVLAFVLFRLYDIIKPFGIKKVEKIGNGLGIMLDDEIAGIYAGLTTIFLAFLLNKGGIL